VRDRATGQVRKVEAEPERRVETAAGDWDTVIEAMERVVMSGTGALARVPGVRVAGKTGTAQNPHGEDHALFIAFAPVDDPRVAIAVVVENAGHGGSIAAPIAQKAMAAYLLPPAPLAKAAHPVRALAPPETLGVDTSLIRGD
jgi:penicillin-binding protein 2